MSCSLLCNQIEASTSVFPGVFIEAGLENFVGNYLSVMVKISPEFLPKITKFFSISSSGSTSYYPPTIIGSDLDFLVCIMRS